MQSIVFNTKCMYIEAAKCIQCKAAMPCSIALRPTTCQVESASETMCMHILACHARLTRKLLKQCNYSRQVQYMAWTTGLLDQVFWCYKTLLTLQEAAGFGTFSLLAWTAGWIIYLIWRPLAPNDTTLWVYVYMSMGVVACGAQFNSIQFNINSIQFNFTSSSPMIVIDLWLPLSGSRCKIHVHLGKGKRTAPMLVEQWKWRIVLIPSRTWLIERLWSL